MLRIQNIVEKGSIQTHTVVMLRIPNIAAACTKENSSRSQFLQNLVTIKSGKLIHQLQRLVKLLVLIHLIIYKSLLEFYQYNGVKAFLSHFHTLFYLDFVVCCQIANAITSILSY